MIGLLGKAASGYVKPSFDTFVKAYRDVVRGLENLEGKRRTLQERRERADDKKKAGLDKEAEEIDAEEKQLLATEKELLEKAKVPTRNGGAQRLGGEQRGGR